MPNPDPSDQAPGARNLARIFAETLQAHADALSAGDEFAAELTPQGWTGKARAAFVESDLRKVDAEREKIATTHQSAVDLFAGYRRFLDALPELWSAYAGDPAQRARLWELWYGRTCEVASELSVLAATLDTLGHIAFPESAPVSVGPPEPTSHKPENGQTSQEIERQDSADSTTQPAAQGIRHAAAMFQRSYQTAERLRDQVLTGERRDHVPWQRITCGGGAPGEYRRQ